MTSDPIGDMNDAQGRELLDSDGQRLGQIREIFLDEATGRPAWAAVDVPGGGDDLVLAPLAGATEDGDAIRVAVTRERVETSPSTSGLTERFSPDHMDRVRAHYADQPTAAATADTAYVADVGHQVGTGASGELPGSMVRSEEELFIERERVPHERVRLVKRIVTETVTQSVEVRREEFHLERVPLTTSAEGVGGGDTEPGAGTTDPSTSPTRAAGYDPGTRAVASDAGAGAGQSAGGRGLSGLKAKASGLVGRAGGRFGGGHGFGEPFEAETIDLTLYEEEVVISKRVVPRERVRIHREIVTVQQRISDNLRKERVEVEHLGLDGGERVMGDQRADETFVEGHRPDDSTR